MESFRNSVRNIGHRRLYNATSFIHEQPRADLQDICDSVAAVRRRNVFRAGIAPGIVSAQRVI